MPNIIIKTDPKPKERDWAKQPATLEEWRMKKVEGRDYKKYPLTVKEIQGWTSELKEEDRRRQAKIVIKKKPT